MSSYWIEGIGNEVIASCALSAAVVILFLYLSRRLVQARPHPGQVDSTNVTGARTDVGRGVGDSAELESCPICLAHLSFPVDTYCGHTFCAQCILSYWQHDQWPLPARCPVCRNEVTLLLPCAALSTATNSDLWRTVVDYNRRFSGQPRSFIQYIQDVPAIIGHMWRLLFTVEGVLLLYRLHILLLLLLLMLYLISPFDLIPETVVGALGFLDDIIILIAVVIYSAQIYRQYIINDGT